MSYALSSVELSAKITARGQRIFVSNAFLSQKSKLKVGDKLRLELNPKRKELTLVKDPNGTISVTPSGKRFVVDVHNKAVQKTLGNAIKRVNIFFFCNKLVIRATQAGLKAYQRILAAKRRMQSGEALTMGETCSGIGALGNAIASGFERAGNRLRLAFANEMDLQAMEAATRCATMDDDTLLFNCSMEQIPFEDIPQVDVLVAGLSCKGASKQARTGKDKSITLPEFHSEAGWLVGPFMHLAMTANPLVIVLENVAEYLDTASAEIMRQTFSRLGYVCHETVQNAEEFGALEARKRMAMVFTTVGMPFDINTMVDFKKPVTQTMADVIRHDDPEIAPLPTMDVMSIQTEDDMAATKTVRAGWYPKHMLLAREEKKKAQGKGHRACIIEPSDTRISTLTASYGKGVRLDESVVQSPCGQWVRLLTKEEHARIKGIDVAIVEAASKTIAHRLLGNSVCVHVWEVLGNMLGVACQQWLQPKAMAIAA